MVSEKVEGFLYIGVVGILFFIIFALIPDFSADKGLLVYSIFLVIFGFIAPIEKFEMRLNFIIIGFFAFLFYLAVPTISEIIFVEVLGWSEAEKSISMARDFRLLIYSIFILFFGVEYYTEEKVHRERLGKVR